MNVDVDEREHVIIIAVSGRVDSNTSPELNGLLTESVDKKKHIIINLHEVDYMSSAGIRALVAALRTSEKNKKRLILAELSQRVSEVIDLAGLRSIFEIQASTDEALIVLISD